jgi:hypothetical protein
VEFSSLATSVVFHLLGERALDKLLFSMARHRLGGLSTVRLLPCYSFAQLGEEREN